MATLNPPEDFEPTKGTKKLCLYTRKSPIEVGSITLPGLFQTAHFPRDAFAVVVIVLGEFYGLYNLFLVAQVSLAYFGGVFLADFICAILAHLPQRTICMAKNRLMFAKADEDENAIAKEKYKISKARRWSRFFASIIVLIALAKVVSFYGLQGGVITGVTLAVLLSYGVVAALHITSTGYWLFEFILRRVVRWQKSNFLSADPGEKTKYDAHEARKYPPVESETELEEATINGKHALHRREDGIYILETKGVLTDHQLIKLIETQQKTSQKEVVAVEGLKRQLNILQRDPLGQEEEQPQSTEPGREHEVEEPRSLGSDEADKDEFISGVGGNGQ